MIEDKILIEINKDNLCKIALTKDGLKENKYMNFKDVLNLLKNASYGVATDSGDNEISEIYPYNDIIKTIQVKKIGANGAKWYVMLRSEAPQDMILGDKKYKNIGMPKTLFAVKVFQGKVAKVIIGCVKDEYINQDTIIYKYPFSNVFDTESVCWGGNMIGDFDVPTPGALIYLPEMFFAMPNNKDGYYSNNNSGKEYHELLKELLNEKFNNDYLKESFNTKTYDEFMAKLN